MQESIIMEGRHLTLKVRSIREEIIPQMALKIWNLGMMIRMVSSLNFLLLMVIIILRKVKIGLT